jgi:hypothetical protein
LEQDTQGAVPDPNATVVGSYFHYGNSGNASGYWSPADQTDTITYEFDGSVPMATLTLDSKAGVFNGSPGSNWVGAYSTNGGATFTPFFTVTSTSANNNVPELDTFNVGGATDVLVRYAATNDMSGDYWLQLFRSEGPGSAENFAFTASATFVPEPSAMLALSALSMMGLVCFAARRRNDKPGRRRGRVKRPRLRFGLV